MNLDKIVQDKNFQKRCNTFITLLQKWGRVHNLSGKLSKEDIEENILDSIYPFSFINDFNSFADIGTGAGYPGFIIAMARPEVKSYLIEPRIKRVAFLNFVKNILNLHNIEIISSRVEEVKEELKVDLITSRAVTNTTLLLDITTKIVKDNTSYLFYKGSLLPKEIEEITIKNYKIVNKKERNYLYIKGK